MKGETYMSDQEKLQKIAWEIADIRFEIVEKRERVMKEEGFGREKARGKKTLYYTLYQLTNLLIN